MDPKGRKYEKYWKIGINELLSKMFFNNEEVAYLLLSGTNKKQLKTSIITGPIPHDVYEKPDDFSIIKFRFRDGDDQWRHGEFRKIEHEDYQFMVRIGKPYNPFWKKYASGLNSVYGKISAKFQNVLSDIF